jgi:putative glutamine amidotransferase
MKIGITDCHKEDKFNKYVEWIQSVEPESAVVKLSCNLKNAEVIDDLDALVLTGGGDIDPEFYDLPNLSSQARDVNKARDTFEIEVVHRSLEANLPVLGVCRGMQLMNVALGGSLHVDLQSRGFNDHTSPTGGELKHAITIRPNSLLSGLAGGLKGEVNSYHHQGVDRLGHGLMAVAQSSDGVIESAEWSSKEGMPFLLLVQWHPERANRTRDVFSTNLARIFLQEVRFSIANNVL